MKTRTAAAAAVDMDVPNVSLDSTINATLTPSKLVTSTPFKAPLAPRGRAKKTAGKKKVFINPVCATCSICGQEYRCNRAYKKHMRKHSIQDAASRYPNLDQIMDHCSNSAFPLIENLAALPAFSDCGQRYKELLTALKPEVAIYPEWNDFLAIIHGAVTKSIGDSKILLPSALVNILMGNLEQLLSNQEERSQLRDLLNVFVQCEFSVADCFIADYAMALVKGILKFYSSSLKASSIPKEVEKEVVFDIEDKEAIHYVSGSVVRGFYRKGQLFPKNVGWCKISLVIVQKLLESDTVPGPPAIVKGWTIAKNKGKLFFVCGLLFDFFVGVAQILERMNSLRVDHEQVIELVCERGIMLLWDDAVGEALSEKASYDLMCGMIRSFCNTYAVGKAKQVINDFRKNKAEASIPLRHKVAPKT